MGPVHAAAEPREHHGRCTLPRPRTSFPRLILSWGVLPKEQCYGKRICAPIPRKTLGVQAVSHTTIFRHGRHGLRGRRWRRSTGG